MAEPFAAAVFAEEDKGRIDLLPDPRIKTPAYKPAWEVVSGPSLGATEQATADVAARSNAREIADIPDTVGRAFRSGGNYAVQVAKDIERIASSGDVDPLWREGDNKKWLLQNRKEIDENQDWRYLQTNNLIEAEAMKADAISQAQDAQIMAKRGGVSTFIGQGLAGILDIDTIPALMLGGVSLTAKAGINTTKLSRLAEGVAGGALSSGLAGTAAYGSDPNSDWTVIPLAGLAGAAFGGAGAYLAKAPVGRANAARLGTLDELGETIADGFPRAKENMQREAFVDLDAWGSEQAVRDAQLEREMAEAAAKDLGTGAKKPAAFDPLDAEQPGKVDADLHGLTGQQGPGSIGARQMTPNGPGIAAVENKRLLDIIQSARTRVQQTGVATTWLDGWGSLQGGKAAIGKQAERFHNMVSNSPLATDFSRAMNSGSAVMQMLAYDLMENGTGIVRNARSGARVMEHYTKTLLSKFQHFEDAFSEYAGTKGVGWFQRNWDTSHRDNFNREVAAELQARYYDGVGATSDNAVKRAADSIDATFKDEVDISKGRPGETAVFGSDVLQAKSGYMPQKWLGRNIKNLIENGGHTKKNVVDAIAEGYRMQHPSMARKDAEIYATAVVERAEKFEAGINTNLIGILQEDGRTEMADILMRQGTMSAAEVESFIQRLTTSMEERGKTGHLKNRLDIDLRYTSTNGIRIMDLVDTDFQTMIPKRVRRSAGQAALARKGIASRADWDAIKQAALEEQRVNGKSQPTGSTIKDRALDYLDSDKHVDAEWIDNLYTYFSGDPIAGGISPMLSRMKKLTNLALLNQLGMTQMAEFGVTIASVGVEQFMRHAGEAFTGELKKIDSPLVQELKHMSIFVPEEKLFRDDLVHEFEKHVPTSEYLRGLDRILNKGQRIQGYTSGFYAMRTYQQRIAVTSAADKLAKHFRDGGLISDPRLYDMGLGNNADVAKLKQYVDNGTVEFDAKGNLTKLNMDRWAPEDVELFAYTLNASTNTLVQKAMAGESSMMFHKDGLAQLFWHLKSFPMLALEKQALRQTRIMDTESMMSFMYGLGTAAAAYSARQVINGRDENLSFDKIARGAFGYSNMTGWIPMWVDPLGGMLGIDSLNVGGYNGRGGGEVLSIPPVITTINKMAQLPGSIIGTLANGPDNGEINALSSTPLVGNAYGFAYIFNAIKRDNSAAIARAAKEEKKAEAPVAQPEKPKPAFDPQAAALAVSKK